MADSEELQPRWQKINTMENFQTINELMDDSMFKVGVFFAIFYTLAILKNF